jgi:hypothetical protein
MDSKATIQESANLSETTITITGMAFERATTFHFGSASASAYSSGVITIAPDGKVQPDVIVEEEVADARVPPHGGSSNP